MLTSELDYNEMHSTKTTTKGMGLTELLGKEDPVDFAPSLELYGDTRAIGYMSMGGVGTQGGPCTATFSELLCIPTYFIPPVVQCL